MAQATKKSAHKASKTSAHKAAAPAALHVASKAIHNMTPVTKITNKVVEDAVSHAKANLETARNSTKSVLNIGTDTMKGLFLNSTDEAKKTHAKVFAISRESSEGVSRAVGSVTRALNDIIALGRENIDVAVEVSNIVADITKSANSELINYANGNFTDNLDIFNEVFGCRNINDAVEINNKWVSTNLENFFAQSSRFSDMLFQFATEASEPINDHITESTERLSKSLAA